jgi:hypothetical protein
MIPAGGGEAVRFRCPRSASASGLSPGFGWGFALPRNQGAEEVLISAQRLPNRLKQLGGLIFQLDQLLFNPIARICVDRAVAPIDVLVVLHRLGPSFPLPSLCELNTNQPQAAEGKCQAVKAFFDSTAYRNICIDK